MQGQMVVLSAVSDHESCEGYVACTLLYRGVPAPVRLTRDAFRGSGSNGAESRFRPARADRSASSSWARG